MLVRHIGVPAAGKQAGRAALLLALLFVAGLGGGCKKSAPAPSLLPPPRPETIARVRWLGKQRLAADTNAASLMAVWNMEESRRLEAQTLDRLAVGLLTTNDVSGITNEITVTPIKSSGTNQPSAKTNYQARLSGPPALLRPLLEDLLEQEAYVEVRQVTNQPGELALAVRLNPERARLWETNLASVLESLAGSRVAAVPGRTNGWQMQCLRGGAQTWHIELAHAGEWTVLGLAPHTNALAGELCSLIQQMGMPFPPQPKTFWLYAEGDFRRVVSALSLGWDLPADLPKLTLAINGDGQSVRMRGQLDFAKPLSADLGQWSIPTNLIHEPLVSFTAIRGVAPWLSSTKAWQNLQIGPPPDQLYFWAENGLPFLSFVAARLPDASNQVSQLAGHLVEQANPWIATNSQGALVRSTNGNGVVWQDLPLLEPFLRSVSDGAKDVAFGGLVRDLSTNRPPAVLFQQVTDHTNLVAYDWELTGTRVVQWLYFGQFFRLFLHHAQISPKTATVPWISALEFKLGNCVSALTKTGPAQLSLARRSTMGLNSVELHLLADWLESPQFPCGLRTFRGPPETPLGKKRPHRAAQAGTNAAPGTPSPPVSK